MKKILLFLVISLFSFFAFSQSINNGLLLHYPIIGNCIDESGNNFNGDVHAELTTDKNTTCIQHTVSTE